MTIDHNVYVFNGFLQPVRNGSRNASECDAGIIKEQQGNFLKEQAMREGRRLKAHTFHSKSSPLLDKVILKARLTDLWRALFVDVTK